MTDLISSAASSVASVGTMGASAGLTASFVAAQQAGKLHGLSPAFQVQVLATGDPAGLSSLGFWSGCSGLKVSWDFVTFKVGNYSGTPVNVPRGVKYDNVTLKRGITKMGWAGSEGDGMMGVRKWLRDMATNPPPYGAGPTIKITLFDAWTDPVAIWELKNAFPVSWQGPDMDANAKTIAMETLVITHDGFLDPTYTIPPPTSMSGAAGAVASVGASISGAITGSIG